MDSDRLGQHFPDGKSSPRESSSCKKLFLPLSSQTSKKDFETAEKKEAALYRRQLELGVQKTVGVISQDMNEMPTATA